MGLTLSIRDLRGCHSAEIIIDGIALVGGANGAGKSSILGGAAAALTGRSASPFVDKGGKDTGNQLVRDGAKDGKATLKSDAGFSAMFWPSCQGSTKGAPPRGSVISAGITSPLELPERDRAKLLGDALKAEPSAEDLMAALRDAGLGEEEISDAVSLLNSKPGWDEAWAAAKEEGAKAKGRWEAVTHRKYGSQIAASWQPDGFAAGELGDDTIEALEQAVAGAKREVEAALQADAVDQAEIGRLETTAGGHSDAEGAVERARGVLAEAEASLKKAQDTLAALPPTHTGIACPHCGGFVHVQKDGAATSLVAVELVSESEVQKRRTAEANASSKVVGRQREVGEARTALQTAEVTLREAAAAVEKLAKRKEAAAGPTDADVGDARTRLADTEKRLAALKAKTAADQAHALVTAIVQIVTALAPEGVRKTKLGRVLDAFNDGPLASLSEAAGWRRIELTPDLTANYGGRPYMLLSLSEKWRVRAVLQVALAGIEAADLVILDGADILDLPSREGLIMMLMEAGTPALVGMTSASASRVPDLAGAECGSSWWVENGVCVALGDAQQKAAA